MRLSNKSTFSLVCFILILALAFAAMPAMAQTIEATWSPDRNDDDTVDDPGWRVTIAGLANSDTVSVFSLDPAGTAARAEVTGQGFGDVAADATSTTGQITAIIGQVVAVQVVAGASGSEVTYQRVTFPAGGPGATLAATDLIRLPLLMDLTTSQYYATFNEEVTVTFDFAAAVDGTNGAPTAPLHISDVALGDTTNWQIVSVSGTNMVTLRSTYATGAKSAATTVDLGAVFAQPTDPATDGQASVLYDNTAPTITAPPGIVVAAPPGSPSPPNNVWGGDYPVFNITFSVADDKNDKNGSGLPDTDPVRIDTDRTKLDVGPVGLGTLDNTVSGTEYLVQITPKADRATTAGEDVVINIISVDNAGNEGMGSISVKLAMNTPPDALYQSADPASGNVMRDGTITVTFDKDPGTVMATNATVSGSGNTRTLTVGATQAAGALSITLTWGDSGRQVLAYTVVIPDDPAIAFSSADPATGGTVMAGNTVMLTFAADPGTVTSSPGDISGTGTTRTLTIPAGQAAGDVTITISWTMAGREAGSQTLMYAITRPFVSQNPTLPANISAPINIPANSYVIVVRDEEAMYKEASFSFPKVDGVDVMIREWPNMPDLQALFDRNSFGQGGALVLRRSEDARDNDMQDADGNNIGMYATPAVGTVGISEIMWALDEGQLNRDRQVQGQWIELHNLNSKPVNVLLYAQTARELVSNGLVGNTAAGDTIVMEGVHGLSGMVIDAITNIRNKGDQTQQGWDVPGDNGNSVTGDALTSMHRILPHNQPSYANANNRRYNNRDGRDGGVWAAASNVYAVLETERPGSANTVVIAITDYKGTPGNRNDYTGVGLLKPADKTNVPANTVIFNEVANLSNSNADYEWIELHNLTGGEINLRNYLISIVTAVDSESIVYQFPNNDAAKIPANGVFLLVASDPRDEHNQPSEHPLAIGWDVDRTAENQIRGLGDSPPRYKVTGNLNLPDNGQFVLILRKAETYHGHRSGAGPHNQGVAEVATDLHLILDIAGHHPNLFKDNYPNAISSTRMWPLYSFGRGPQFNRNQFHENTVHYRAHTSGIADGLAGAGAQGNHNDHRAAFQNEGYTGVGYKRQAARINANGGTPGYLRNVLQGRTSGTAKLVISEIMLTQGTGTGHTRLPQWIEIYNPNNNAVNLSADHGWRIVIEEERIALRTINFKTKGNVKWVQPGQTILVVSGAARDLGHDYLPVSVVFPSTRVYNVYNEQRGDFGMANRYDPFLDMNSFDLQLIDGQGNVSDRIGNLDGNVRTSDEAKWDFTQDAITKDGLRTSYIRIFDNNVARDAHNLEESNVLPLSAAKADDTINLARHQIPAKYAWLRASQADLGVINIRHIWYGSEEDYGTPLYREGAILPVSLSYFRPTLEDGKVVIRWTTESELDNAGFNIYRSESRNGEFTQVNDKLIQGQGTTAERSNYKWVDTSAKPGVAYFYQIEDVSFAGERQTLRTTKMKGLVSAENKLTIKWGELKEVQ